MDRIGEDLGVVQISGFGLHPEDVSKGSDGQGLGDCVGDAALDLVVAFRGAGNVAVPDDIDPHGAGLLSRFDEGGRLIESVPLLNRHRQFGAFVDVEGHDVGDGIAIGLQARFHLPQIEQACGRLVQRRVDIGSASARQVFDRGFNFRCKTGFYQPLVCFAVHFVGDAIHQVAVDLRNPLAVELAHDRQERGLVVGDVGIRRPEDEAVVAFIAAAIKEGGGLRVGARDDDAWDLHQVELKACRIQAFDLFIHRYQHLACLVTALFHAGFLVLDMVPGDADFDEAPHQVADMGITAMTGVGVGDDEGSIINLRCARPLFFTHAQALKILVAVGGDQRPDQRCGLFGDLAQGVAGQVWAGVFFGRALGRGCPAAEIDPLDPHALHRYGLAGRVGAEGRNRFMVGKKLTQAFEKGVCGVLGDGVLNRDGAALLDDLVRRVQA